MVNLPCPLLINFLLILSIYSTHVSVSQRSLLLDNNPFYICGINYNPIPIGSDPNIQNDYYTIQYQDIWSRDIPNIRDMNANFIRIYGWNNEWDHTEFLDTLYNDGEDPIYVGLTFWFAKVDITDDINRANLKAKFRQMVAKYKSHPAISMWLIGNELNSVSWYGSTPAMLNSMLTLADEMAMLAHLEDPDHPVALPFDGTTIESTITQYDTVIKYIDIWAVQLYRGLDFGTFFVDYPKLSNRPVFMSEFGLDSLDDRTFTENATMQLDYDVALWRSIVENKNINIGGAVFEYSDEWWKGRQGANDSRHSDCPSYTPGIHNYCGMPIDAPDGYSNEEWYGMYSISSSGTPGEDDLTERPVYSALKAEFAIIKGNDLNKSFIGLIIAVTIAGVLVLATIGVLVYRHCSKKLKKSEEMMQLMENSKKYNTMEPQPAILV